jgi:Nucleotidyl transferase AbiEii toxin, Type IV TA system
VAARRFQDPAAFRQSLEERLRQVAATRGVAVNALRLKLLIERLLARLFAEARSPWLLKGGYAMELRFRPRGRTTRDLDLSCASDAADDRPPRRIESVRELLQEAAARDVGDHLVFRIGEPGQLIEAAPEGGARFPVIVLLAGREYGRFHVDVGLGTVPPGEPERLIGDDLLAFAGIPPATALAIPRETQFAEKIHAYTRPWDDRINTRTKDLVDLLLLIEAGLPDRDALFAALRQAFAGRGSHALPAALPAPPPAWRRDFAVLAEEVALPQRDLDAAFLRLESFWFASGLGSA